MTNQVPEDAIAVVALEPYRVALQKVRVCAPNGQEVAVRVLHSWISNGTESSFLRGERIQGDTPRGPSDPLPFPHVPGYQKCGIVEYVGASVPDLKIGDEVFVSVSGIEGMFYETGGHVSPAVAHFSQVWKLPKGVSCLAACGLVLTQVGYNCGACAPVADGDAAVVIGDGLVGHWTAQTLKSRGARVAMIGRHEERLARFQTRDNDLRLLEKSDTTGKLRDWASDGIAIVVDTVGSIAAMERLYPLLVHGAHLVSAGFYGDQGEIDIQRLRERELTLHAPAGWTRERIDATLELLARGELQTEPLITHRFPIGECERAYDLILSRSAPVLGVVLDWE